ncbi:MAG TPA: hypothetical protein VFH70_07450 [Acidimicrobiales bacterium]|nr:hypothetical protein [Acidimicrobiales bacterium]
MPSDEELRKVAEDVRALARSLARDLHEATRSARGGGHTASEAFRQGLREAAQDARKEFAKGFGRGFGRHWNGPGAQQWLKPPSFGNQPGGSEGLSPQGPTWTRPPRSPSPRPSMQPRHPCAGRSRSPLPPIRRHWDASAILAMLAVLFGTAWLLSAVGVLTLSAEAVMAAGLMLLGAALVVTARTDWGMSRHAWPVFLGGALIIGLFATSSTFGVDGAISHMKVGDATVTPAGTGSYYGGVGKLTVDAGSAPPGAVINVESVAGQTVITHLPPGETVDVSARVFAGEICLGPQSASGVGASAGPVTVQQGTGVPVTITVHQTAGQIDVAGQGCGRNS